MESRGVCSVATALAVLALVVMAPEAAGQTLGDCATKLVTCSGALTSSGPPSTDCCNTIGELVKNELTCLCGLLNDKETLKSIGVDVNKALEVPKRCGIQAGTSLCNSSTNSTTTTSAKAPASAPPATPGNAAVGVQTGVPALVALVALWWSLLAY